MSVIIKFMDRKVGSSQSVSQLVKGVVVRTKSSILVERCVGG